MVDIATEHVPKHGQKPGRSLGQTPATERQVQSICSSSQRQTRARLTLACRRWTSASLSKWKANNIIAALAEEAVWGRPEPGRF